MTRFTTYLLLILALPLAVAADIDVYQIEDEANRTRYQELVTELRCPKCQNQNLLDSNSAISEDLRREVLRLVEEGYSDEDVKTYMVERYGDFVLYRPPVQENTVVLWLAPSLMALIGLLVFAVIVVRRSHAVRTELRTSGTIEEGEDQGDDEVEESMPNAENQLAIEPGEESDK